MIKIKPVLSKPPSKGSIRNFSKLFYYDTHKLKKFPVYDYHGLSALAILQKIPQCKYESWQEERETILMIRIKKATISCVFNPIGICTQADLFPDR